MFYSYVWKVYNYVIGLPVSLPASDMTGSILLFASKSGPSQESNSGVVYV